MCGIAAIFRPDGAPVSTALLRSMTASLAPRGPDGEGFHLAPGIGLGHRRLAVIDLAGGGQPLCNEDRSVWIIHNGEIYGFRELRTRLATLGHCFRTRSDSEVIVHAYEQWGDECIAELDGMFAFALWDGKRRRLLCARDRMGKKPLYHARVACPDASPDWALLVASELKALLCCETLDDAVDLGALGRYLIYEAVPAPRTIVRGARKLEPGCALAVDQGGETTWRYYDLPLPAGRPAAARREAAVAAGEAVASEGVAVEVREQLAAAVRRRLVADVPLGVFLSGGLDSSAVTALMAEVVPPPEIQTFAIGFEDPSFDESAHARKVAATLGTCHHQAVLSPRLLIEVLPEVTSFLDEPLGDASLVPTFLLARFTRQHVTVALSGDGGDELFAGYPTFQAERLHRLFYAPAPAALRRLATIIAGWLPVSHANISLDFRAKQFLRGAAEPNLGRRHQAWLGSFLPVEIASLLTPDATVTLHGDDPFSDVDAHLRACPSQNPWDLLLYLYCKLYLAEDILVKVDRAAMAVGLETRAPFLDSQIVALACRLPPALRLRRLCSKYILKQALRGRLPEAILRRPKKGFGIPVARWLRGELRPMLADELASGKLRREGFFAPAVVTRVVGDHLAGRRDLRKPLWTLLAFERWLGAWGRGGSCRRAPLAVAP